MGNTNSQPARDSNGDPSNLGRSRSPSVRRYHSIAQSNLSAHAQKPGGTGSVGNSRAAARGTPVFGRISSHDETSSPARTRSRSSSTTGFWAPHRRGSEVAEVRDPFASRLPGRADDVIDAIPECSVAAPLNNGSALESVVRKSPAAMRKLPSELQQLPPSTPQGFDPRNFVSPHPSPSVATHPHYASGLPSHHSATPSSDSGHTSSALGSTVLSHASVRSIGASQPQQVPSTSAHAPHKLPLFGIGGGGGGSIFPPVSTSLSTSAATSPPVGNASPVVSSMPQAAQPSETDSLSPREPAALPSYLKIPTTIPSTYASATTPLADGFGASADLDDFERSSSPSPHSDELRHSRLLSGGGAAAAVLDPVDIVIGPGHASRVSSPIEERRMSFGLDTAPDRAPATGPPGQSLDAEEASARADQRDDGEASSQQRPTTDCGNGSSNGNGGNAVDEDARESRSLQRATVEEATNRANSRTPTPTPGTYGPRAMTPTAEKFAPLRPMSPSSHNATSEGPPASPTIPRKLVVEMQAAVGESGANTPALPPGLTSAPPSASVPAFTRIGSHGSEQPTTPTVHTASTAAAAAASPAVHPVDRSGASSRSETPSRSTIASQLSTPTKGPGGQPPLMPIVLTWTSGGREVFVTGTFANEWRSKILLHRSRRDHSCVLHLPPGTHRLKFIVDDRWRVSRDLPTATDGDGNLVNYVEIPNVGPALSAPGEDLPGARERAPGTGHTRDRSSKIESKRTTMDLVEEARKAQAARRGDLDDVFGPDDAPDSEESWTREIPASLLAAQEAEEEYRESLEGGGGSGGEGSRTQQHQRGDSGSQAALPSPPALPRQLEKVILNSSPANTAGNGAGGTVDDNSILPAPNHVVLNHLTASSIKGGVLAVGTTTRYKRKYVTTVYYRPVQV
ncbi:galactose metabolism-related protein [Thecaphora frezii]